MNESGTRSLLAFFGAAEDFARREVERLGAAVEVYTGEDLVRLALQVASRDVCLGPDEVVLARAVFERLWRQHYMGCAPAEAPSILAKAASLVTSAARARRATEARSPALTLKPRRC